MSDLAEAENIARRENPLAAFFFLVGQRALQVADYVGGVSQLAVQTFVSIGKSFVGVKDTIAQFELIGYKSASLTNLIAIFTGMVLAVQFVVGLKRFGLQLYTGQIIGIAITRELGPVLTALMVAARVGSGIAAELGSMAVSEQVLAIEAMGANPVRKLVVPRVVACMICTPLLTVFADIIGILGGMIITVLETGIGVQYYLDQIKLTIEHQDYLSGIAKTVFFGFFIGIIACYQGLSTKGGTAGVGKATTMSVVISSIVIFISDFFLTKFFLAVF